jgi:putative DNA primase/helicase
VVRVPATLRALDRHEPQTDRARHRRSDLAAHPAHALDVEIPAGERDPDLLDKLRAELPGILRWAVGGHAAYLRDGLGAPDEVVAATETYRREEDLVARFLDECCDVAPGLRERPSTLYEAFTDYIGRSERVSSRWFYQELDRRGFDQMKSGSSRYRIGLKVSDGTDE